MKTKFVSLIASAFAFAAFTAHAETTLSVAATAVPHAEILEHVKPVLAKEGIALKVKVFTDYVQPNVQVAEKKIDVNFFQHKPYLDEFNKDSEVKYTIDEARATMKEFFPQLKRWKK